MRELEEEENNMLKLKVSVVLILTSLDYVMRELEEENNMLKLKVYVVLVLASWTTG